MKLTLTIPDEVYEAYEAQAARLNGKAAAADMIRTTLDRFKHVHAADRVVVVDSKSREKLELLFGGSQLVSGEDLMNRVKALADLEIGSIKVEFSTAQWRIMKGFATRHGRTIQDIVSSIVSDIKYQLLNRVS